MWHWDIFNIILISLLLLLFQKILEKYEGKDIYNADETGLFWRCLPNKTLAFTGDKVQGRKSPKNRITLLVGANMDGSHKLPLLIIGL